MTQVSYRGNLSAAKFPLVSKYMGRSIVVPQYDNVYVPAVASKTDEDKDRGIPQIYYCHNVLPTDQGFQSIGYRLYVNPVTLVVTAFDSVFEIRQGSKKAFFAHNADGTNWLCQGINWLQLNTIAGTENKLTTVAIINGETYVYFSTVGCYRIDFTTNLLVAVVLAGITVADVVGITAAAGYMIMWATNGTDIAWSSTIDPLDFVPSLITGAGGGAVQGIRGKINICAPHALGILIYTDNNVVAAVYSGNARYPFNFREVTGSGGCSSLDLISWDANSSVHYAYTSSGVQTISTSAATTIVPEVTDFLAGKLFEDFNETTLQFEYNALTVVMKKKLTTIADRYLVLSYGVVSLTHALVLDLITRRLGKLKIPHVDCFEWSFFPPDLQGAETPKDTIAFLQQDGTVKIVNFFSELTTADGVMIIGKFQFIRQRMLQMQRAEIENITPTDLFKLYDLVALDGKNWVAYEGYLAHNQGLVRAYSFNEVGLNHALLWKGAFNAVSYVLYFNVHGKAGM